MNTIQLMKRRLSFKQSGELKKWRSIASKILNDLESQSIFLNFGDSSAVLSSSDCIRAVSETVPESPIRNLLLKCMLDAESRSAGAAWITLSIISGQKTYQSNFGSRFTLDDARSGLVSLTDRLTADIVMEAISISGRRGKIMLDASDVQKTEITYGTQACKWVPVDSFFNSLGRQKISAQNCIVVFVDGIIESVAECHKIFNDSYEKKIPIVIFARGYGEEVINTAAINIQRQTAHVIPILIPFDEVGVNSMADLAMSFNTDVISSDKGQLISSINLDECVRADRITCTLTSTEIEFKNSSIDRIVSNLTERLKTSDNNQSELIRKRISALGTGLVTIKVGSDKKSTAGIQRDRIDFGLRYVKSCMANGISRDFRINLPFSSIKSGEDSAKAFISIVENCGGILEVDRCG